MLNQPNSKYLSLLVVLVESGGRLVIAALDDLRIVDEDLVGAPRAAPVRHPKRRIALELRRQALAELVCPQSLVRC